MLAQLRRDDPQAAEPVSARKIAELPGRCRILRIEHDDRHEPRGILGSGIERVAIVIAVECRALDETGMGDAARGPCGQQDRRLGTPRGETGGFEPPRKRPVRIEREIGREDMRMGIEQRLVRHRLSRLLFARTKTVCCCD